MSEFARTLKAIDDLEAEGFVVHLRPFLELGAVRCVDIVTHTVEIGEDKLAGVTDLADHLVAALRDIADLRWQGHLPDRVAV